MSETQTIRLHGATSVRNGSPSFSEVAAASLDARWEKYQKELIRCRRKCSEKAVHDLRVATRRLISILDIISTAVEDGSLSVLQRRLRKRFREFGPLRDVQIQLLQVEKMRDEFPEVEAFYTLLLLRERRLIKNVERTVRKENVARLGREIAAVRSRVSEELGNVGINEVALSAARGATASAFMKTMALLRKAHADAPKSIHRVRVSFKKFRYMVESLRPLIPGVTAGTLKAMNRYQVRMGLIQDNEVLTAAFRNYLKRVKKGPRLNYLRFTQRLRRDHAGLVEDFLRNSGELGAFWDPGRSAGRFTRSA